MTNRASEAWCWGLLAIAQVHAGQVQQSLRSGRLALALAQESKNIWVELPSALGLTYGLLEAGASEEALVLLQQAVALARTLAQKVYLQGVLSVLGKTYHALQQWEEARSAFEEAEAIAKTLDFRTIGVDTLSWLCMHYVLAGEWQQAYHYALKAIAVRKRSDVALFSWDFASQYETEALLHGGDERQAREEAHRLGERVGPYPRYRIPYLRSLAVLAAWEGHSEQAIGHLREAAGLAEDLRLPGEQWQIQAMLGTLYEAAGEQEQARTAFRGAATIIQGLAEGIKEETLRSRFLAGPQIQQVVQQAQGLANPVPKDL